MKKLLLALTAVILMAIASPVQAADAENTLYLDLKDGRVTIELRPDLAPKHVARIKELTRKGFYDGLVFHRVIEGFMAQTGDPTGTGTSGSGQNIEAEFTPEPFVRGTVGMARSASPNSGDSQFFICFSDAQFLNGQYTVWGKVTSGMEFVDKITRGEPPASPDKIVKMVVAADVDKKPEGKQAPELAPVADAKPIVEAPVAPAAETPAAPVAETPAAH